MHGVCHTRNNGHRPWLDGVFKPPLQDAYGHHAGVSNAPRLFHMNQLALFSGAL